MNRKMLKNLAVSGFVLSVATGCSGMGAMADAPSRAAGKPAVAGKSASQARAALESGKAGKAVALAEAAVEASPRDPGFRALLGQAYLNEGRFTSATTALEEAMELGATDSNTVIALALAHIAQNKPGAAVSLLQEHRNTIPASDIGLALALAGDSESAIYVLSEAARAPDANARTRQNLALALALSGRWAQARIYASQDLSLAKVESRMAEWSKLAETPNSQARVASLIGTEARADAGMPVRLALNNYSETQLAFAPAADPAPVATYAPPPVALADAGSAIRSVELPMPERNADGVVPVTELPQPKAAGEVIMADAAPYRAAPRVVGEGRIRPAQQQALELATVLIPRAMAFDSKKPSGWAVQLGAYDSLGIAKEKWSGLQKRSTMLASFPASSHAAKVNGRTFYRLTVNGLASRADATALCNELKAKGQACFIRAMGGAENIQWAAKANPVRLASR